MKALILVLLMTLPACTVVQGSKTYQGVYNGGRDGIKEDTKPLRFKLAKYIYSDDEPPADAKPAAPKPRIYCYRTVANADCYTTPIKGEEDRLME